jgi:ABC-type transport system involved in cytochrome c biogenesis permease subunit
MTKAACVQSGVGEGCVVGVAVGDGGAPVGVAVASVVGSAVAVSVGMPVGVAVSVAGTVAVGSAVAVTVGVAVAWDADWRKGSLSKFITRNATRAMMPMASTRRMASSHHRPVVILGFLALCVLLIVII